MSEDKKGPTNEDILSIVGFSWLLIGGVSWLFDWHFRVAVIMGVLLFAIAMGMGKAEKKHKMNLHDRVVNKGKNILKA